MEHPPEAYGFPHEHEYDDVPHENEYDHHGHGGGGPHSHGGDDGYGSPHLKFGTHVCTTELHYHSFMSGW